MALLPIDTVEPGMVLKSAICDRSGRMLLPAGVELAEKHLKIFRTWGISEADVECEEEAADDLAGGVDNSGDPLVLAEAQRQVELLFIHNDPHHQMIQELMKICVSRRVLNAS